MSEIEQVVLEHIREEKQAYTRTMYVTLKIKSKFGLSLNKFRSCLHDLVDENKLEYHLTGHLSYWSLPKE